MHNKHGGNRRQASSSAVNQKDTLRTDDCHIKTGNQQTPKTVFLLLENKIKPLFGNLIKNERSFSSKDAYPSLFHSVMLQAGGPGPQRQSGAVHLVIV